MSERNPIEWHDLYCSETDIRLRLGPEVVAHFGLAELQRAAPEIKRAIDAIPFREGDLLKQTLSGMSGGMEIICYAHLLNERGEKVKVYYVDSMARFKRCNYGEWN